MKELDSIAKLIPNYESFHHVCTELNLYVQAKLYPVTNVMLMIFDI